MSNERQVGDLLTKCQYKYKDLTRRDVMAALSYFKELSPRADKYVYPNGASKELVSLFGTIPVNFRNSTYNIPVQVYLPDAYPYEAPFVYVRPTLDMSINVSSAVDSNCRVYLPALSEWRHPMSDLYMLLNLLTIKFSEQTPLYSKVKSGGGGSAAAATTASTYSDPPYPTQNPPPYPISGVGMPMPSTATAYSNSPPLIATNPYYPMNNQPPQPLSHLKSNSNSNIGQTRPSYSDDTIKPEHYRMSLITAVHERIRLKYKELSEEKRAEIDSLKKVRTDLESSANELNGLINEAESEALSVRELTAELRRKTQSLSESINRMKYRDKANIEDAVITTTPLYRQIFLLFAEELAIQDLVFYLGEGLAHNTLTLDSFLKQIRALTRKQFILRATIQKAREKAALPI